MVSQLTGMLAKNMIHGIHARRLGRSWAVFAPFLILALFAAFTPTAGIVSADTHIDDEARILELETRLSELLREQAALTTELERRSAIEIVSVRNRWERAIEDLKDQVEHEIQQATGDFEFEARQIILGSRRDGSLRSLKAELDAIIEEKWAWFEDESWQKRQYLRDEIAEIERAKAFELEDFSNLILEIESELHELLNKTGPSTDEIRDATLAEEPQHEGLPEPNGLLNDETADHSPETAASEESGRNRGFFFNSVSADPNGLNMTLDPTALAVIGILITLAATGVQLLKGN